jgi:hypothetical protein
MPHTFPVGDVLHLLWSGQSGKVGQTIALAVCQPIQRD